MPDRTLSGISWEIRIHRNINIILPWQKNAQVTDMGSFSNDGNAKFFEDTAPKNSLFGEIKGALIIKSESKNEKNLR